MKTIVLLVAVLVAGGRVLGRDPNQKIGTGIAPVSFNSPVGGKAQVVVLVKCTADSNDFNADATLTSGWWTTMVLPTPTTCWALWGSQFHR